MKGEVEFGDTRILNGTRPADLVINLKAAKLLGLTLPQSVLTQADKVVQ